MSTPNDLPPFDHPGLLDWLEQAHDNQLDALPYGVIGFDADHAVRRYSRHEAEMAGFHQGGVIGQQVFIELAPCMNNFLVAGRFEEVGAGAGTIDETLPYVLTFRMRPTRVRMRLLGTGASGLRYILVDRTGASS